MKPTPEQLEKAKLLQPEIKEFLAEMPMHSPAPLTLQFAVWHVMKSEEAEAVAACSSYDSGKANP